MSPEEHRAKISALKEEYEANVKSKNGNPRELARKYADDVKAANEEFRQSRSQERTEARAATTEEEKLSLKPSSPVALQRELRAQQQQQRSTAAAEDDADDDADATPGAGGFEAFCRQREPLLNRLLGELAPRLALAPGTEASSQNIRAFRLVVGVVKNICCFEAVRLRQIVFTKIRTLALMELSETTGDEGGVMSSTPAEGTCTLKLRTQNMNLADSADDIKSYIIGAGLANNPEFKVELLESSSSNLRAMWRLLQGNSGMWYTCPPNVLEWIGSKVTSPVVKAYWSCFKVNRRGRPQKRGLAICEKGFFTFGENGTKFRTHTYDEILSIDLHNVKNKNEPFKCTIFLNYIKSERGTLGSSALRQRLAHIMHMCGGMLCAMIPCGACLGKLSIPKLPNPLTLPKLSMPNIKSPLSLGMDTAVKPRPKRRHPKTMVPRNAGTNTHAVAAAAAAAAVGARSAANMGDVSFLQYVCDHKSNKSGSAGSDAEAHFSVVEGNDLVIELAYCLYAAWRANVGPTNSMLPFWTDSMLKKLKQDTDIADLKPQGDEAADGPASTSK